METRFVYLYSFFGENHWSWNEVKLNYTRLKEVAGRGGTNKRIKKGNRTIQENAESFEFKIFSLLTAFSLFIQIDNFTMCFFLSR